MAYLWKVKCLRPQGNVTKIPAGYEVEIIKNTPSKPSPTMEVRKAFEEKIGKSIPNVNFAESDRFEYIKGW